MASGFFPPDDSSVQLVQPTPKVLGTPGYFSDGSLTVEATILDADFLNGLINEFKLLSTTGGIALSKSAPTMVPNIQSLITAGLGNYVLKAGDTMSGNLILGHNYAGNNATTALQIANGSASLNIVPAAPASTVNTSVQAGDTVIWYTGGTTNTGALTIAPYGTGSTGGIRLDNTGAATFTRPTTHSSTLTTAGAATFASTVAISGTATAPTPTANDRTTNIATTAFYGNQAASSAPLVGATSAAIGTSLQFARQDHVHPNQTISHTGDATGSGTTSIPLTLAASGVAAGTYTKITVNAKGLATAGTALVSADVTNALGFTPVQQGGGAGHVNSKLYLGWNGNAPSIQVDATNIGAFGMLGLAQNWSNVNNYYGTTAFVGPVNAYGAISANVINATGAVNTGVLNANGTINSNGSITANNGFIRALYGCRSNLGDANAGVILNDFLTWNPSQNGYQIMPNGLIFQWGFAGGTGGTFNFNISFPSAALMVMASNQNSQGEKVDNAFAYIQNNSQFYLATKRSDSNVISGYSAYWFAIGW